LSQQGIDFLQNEEVKSLLSKELSLVIEPNPVEAGDYSKQNNLDSNINMISMGDNRDWSNIVIPTFDLHQGFDLTKNSMNNMTVGNRQFNPYSSPDFGGYQEQVSRSTSFLTHSSEYEQLRRQHESSNSKYTDPKFKPGYSSIVGFGEVQGYPEDYLRRMEWKRPEQIFNGPYCVFDNSIEPCDIRQGILGNCYFLAACAALAEFPQRIKRIFISKDISSSGVYAIALCINGVWQDVILDDFIPTKPGSGRDIAFNSTVTNELWVILLEKAWAKVHGGYMNTDGGIIREALRDLTGAPCKSYFSRLDTPDVHWERIQEGE